MRQKALFRAVTTLSALTLWVGMGTGAFASLEGRHAIAQCHHSCILNAPRSDHVEGVARCREAQDMAWYFRSCLSSCADIAEIHMGARSAERHAAWTQLHRMFRRIVDPMLESGLWDNDVRSVPNPDTDEWKNACDDYLRELARAAVPESSRELSVSLDEWDTGVLSYPGTARLTWGVKFLTTSWNHEYAVGYYDPYHMGSHGALPDDSLLYFNGVFYGVVTKSRRSPALQDIQESHADRVRADVSVTMNANGGEIRIFSGRVSNGPSLFTQPITIPMNWIDNERGYYQAQTRGVNYASMGKVFRLDHAILAGTIGSVHRDVLGHENFPKVIGAFAAWR